MDTIATQTHPTLSKIPKLPYVMSSDSLFSMASETTQVSSVAQEFKSDANFDSEDSIENEHGVE